MNFEVLYEKKMENLTEITAIYPGAVPNSRWKINICQSFLCDDGLFCSSWLPYLYYKYLQLQYVKDEFQYFCMFICLFS